MSKLVGLMLCRNSDWILGLSARAALMWCDALIIYVHASSDETFQIACEVAAEDGRVEIGFQDDVTFHEMRYRQRMLEWARKRGATHIVTIDDDEVLSGNLLPGIRKMVEETPLGHCLMLPWLQITSAFSMRMEWLRNAGPEGGSTFGTMTSGHWGRSPVSVAFPDHPSLHWKQQPGAYDHHHRHPMGMEFRSYSPISDRSAGLMHFQFASRRRLLAKQFWYQLQERIRWPKRPVDQIRATYTFSVEEAATAKVDLAPESWFAPYSHLMQHLHLDREPWQEKECKRLLKEHPGIEEGLNDFGLLKEWGETT